MTNKLDLEFGEINYQGSKIFSSLADVLGLSVDLTNFLITQALALILASQFRTYLHPSKVSASLRHAYGLVIGLFFGYFCFGQQAIHIAGLPAACYIVIRTQSPRFVQRIVLVVALVYLSFIHLDRQFRDYGSYTIDITGPLMIITQKVVSLAFSIHDGLHKQSKELTKSQQYHQVQKVPSPLEFFSYVLNFQSLMAGPLIFYRDYMEFVEGSNFIKRSSPNGKVDEKANKIIQEPSPVKAVLKKVVASLVCAYIFIKFCNLYPIKNLKDEAFIEKSSFIDLFVHIIFLTTTVRFKYYFAWLLADAICNNAGLGFNGYDSDLTPKWDLSTNIYVQHVELGTSMRDVIHFWNLGTNLWLRMVVYERVPKKYGTILTFALSAVWHGFYPGYYLTFATGALVTVAARKARRMFRHRFQQTEMSRTFYDILTCLVSRVYLAYTTFPFVILEFGASIRIYLKLFMCLHLIALFTVYVLPKFIRGSSGETQSSVPSKDQVHVVDSEKKQLPEGDLQNNNETKDIAIQKQNTQDKSTQESDNSEENQRKEDANYLLKNIITKEVSKIKNETDNLSNLLKEKIEAANIEGLIDKTVSGIVELKDDLMRMNEPEVYGGSAVEGLRKRNLTGADLESTGSTKAANEGVDAFLKKEIEAIKEANVIPTVLSNGHAK